MFADNRFKEFQETIHWYYKNLTEEASYYWGNLDKLQKRRRIIGVGIVGTIIVGNVFFPSPFTRGIAKEPPAGRFGLETYKKSLGS
jgi:hypothetical protein